VRARAAVRVHQAHVGAPLNEPLADGEVGELGGPVQRRVVAGRAEVDVGAVGDEDVDALGALAAYWVWADA